MRNETSANTTQHEVNLYLDDLRSSGITNMFGAGAYVERYFGLDRKTASAMTQEWMRTFGERRERGEAK